MKELLVHVSISKNIIYNHDKRNLSIKRNTYKRHMHKMENCAMHKNIYI